MEQDVGEKCNNTWGAGGGHIKGELQDKKEQKTVPCAMCYSKSQPSKE
jgi:hypothetical protein